MGLKKVFTCTAIKMFILRDFSCVEMAEILFGLCLVRASCELVSSVRI